jgi:amidase
VERRREPLGALVAPVLCDPVIVGGVLAGPTGRGDLDHLTFMVKDMIDVAGYTTGVGNPDWLLDAGVAAASAHTVTRLLAAGATCTGKTRTDELAYSLSGTNDHYGTPPNPHDATRTSGGSSSGSAAAVAAGRCDFALGTDTGGSVRVPAGYCGLYGLRPSHGRVSVDGVVPLAPSFDTVGWFTREASVARKIGKVLLQGASRVSQFSRAVVVTEAFELADPGVAAAVLAAGEGLAKRTGLQLAEGHVAGASGLREWARTFQCLQGREAWETHREWLEDRHPNLGPVTAAKFANGEAITDAETNQAQAMRMDIRRRVSDHLGDDGVMLVPSAPTVAPRLDASDEETAALRSRTLAVTAIAGLTGFPAISLPLAEVDGLPVGVCVIGPPGSDEALLSLGERAREQRH